MTFQYFTKLEKAVEAHHSSVSTIERPDVFFQYPGGEWDMKGSDMVLSGNEYAYVRGTDLNDYMKLALWADKVDQDGGKAAAIIPYLPAARADRGNPLGIRVYGRLIDSLDLVQLICFDPHSKAMPRGIRQYSVFNVTEVTSASLIRRMSRNWGINGIIIPDKGASERASLMSSVLDVPTYQAGKVRDFATGKLTEFTCETLPSTGKMLVVDDICDGGGTFMGLAEATGLPKERLALYVSHGIFSGQAHKLSEYYSQIITTDSFPMTSIPNNTTILPLRFHLEQYLQFGDSK